MRFHCQFWCNFSNFNGIHRVIFFVFLKAAPFGYTLHGRVSKNDKRVFSKLTLTKVVMKTWKKGAPDHGERYAIFFCFAVPRSTFYVLQVWARLLKTAPKHANTRSTRRTCVGEKIKGSTVSLINLTRSWRRGTYVRLTCQKGLTFHSTFYAWKARVLKGSSLKHAAQYMYRNKKLDMAVTLCRASFSAL
jgi:hypothetical protein